MKDNAHASIDSLYIEDEITGIQLRIGTSFDAIHQINTSLGMENKSEKTY